MPPLISRKFTLAFVLSAFCAEAALQSGLFLWSMARAANGDLPLEPGFLLTAVFLPALRSASLLALATYWWSADAAETRRGAMPVRAWRVVGAYVVLAELFSRIAGFLWTRFISFPIHSLLLDHGASHMTASSYLSPFTSLIQALIIVGSSLLAFRLALRLEARAAQAPPQPATVKAAPLTAPTPVESTAVEAAASEAPAGGRRAARKAALIFGLSYLVLLGTAGAFVLELTSLPAISLTGNYVSALLLATAVISIIAYAAARRRLRGPLVRSAPAQAGRAAFRAFIVMYLALLLAITLYVIAVRLVEADGGAFLIPAFLLGILYPILVYPASRRAIGRHYPG